MLIGKAHKNLIVVLCILLAFNLLGVPVAAVENQTGLGDVGTADGSVDGTVSEGDSAPILDEAESTGMSVWGVILVVVVILVVIGIVMIFFGR